MRIYSMLVALLLTVMVVAAYAASGDKPNQSVLKQGTPASSTATSASKGELKFDASYVYLNISSAARPHWRRIGLGGAF